MLFTVGYKMSADAVRKNKFSNNIDRKFSNLNSCNDPTPGARVMTDRHSARKTVVCLFAGLFLDRAVFREDSGFVRQNGCILMYLKEIVASAGLVRSVQSTGWNFTAVLRKSGLTSLRCIDIAAVLVRKCHILRGVFSFPLW